jgi:Na+/H+ antiporter NhaD/arsenite permease-like protein
LAGAELGLGWVLPFAGLLLSIALLPLLSPHFWHRHDGKVSAFWATAALAPLAYWQGLEVAAYELLHVALADYVPFILLLLALFTATGGIRVEGRVGGSPLANTGVLGLGAVLASVMGTTGASMLLVRPLIEANSHRHYQAHIVVFFIFLVANIGGSLTPLGDPPLFLGFLQGVDFFWPTRHMFGPFLVVAASVLLVFFLIDWALHRREEPPVTGDVRIQIKGKRNFLVLVLILLAVVLSGSVKTGLSFRVYFVELSLEALLRDAAMIGLVALSWRLTPVHVRERNRFSWSPMAEVGKVFAGIFITIIPPLAILRAGDSGALGGVLEALSDQGRPVDMAYFWLTGGLSSFLDNAPTYLVFFNAAGGDAELLMGPMRSTLIAISAGAVFMGAMTYIGNAPNFMVRAIAEARGVSMPSFFGYLLWSGAILLPIFGLFSLLYF